jgi:SAM-dependent methyltransferase
MSLRSDEVIMEVQTSTARSGDAFERDAFARFHNAEQQTTRATSAEYERFRHQSVMGALSRRYYAHALEPGCGAGELTAQLARTCDRVTAIDLLQSDVARARARCAPWASVKIHCADIRTYLPEDPVDLIVFSEIGYYFSASELVSIARNLASRMVPGGEFIAAHWLNAGSDHVLHADAVHCQLLANLALRWMTGERYGGLRLDLWKSF